MKLSTYIILLIIFGLSLSAALYFPIDDIWRGISVTPAIGAMVAAIYQILRDHSSYLKSKELQQHTQDFTLGVTSHMAKVAFDKHVEFCEKYMEEVHKTIKTLWQEGPTEKAMVHSRKFQSLRMEYATWMTEKITAKLVIFEDKLFSIGSKTRLSERTKNGGVWEKAYKEADDAWDAVLGQLIDKEKSVDENVAIESVKEKIREILGVDELTELRGLLIQKAVEHVKNT